MSNEKPSLSDVIEKLFTEVASGELHPDNLREALEDALDMGRLTSEQFDEYVRRLEQLTKK